MNEDNLLLVLLVGVGILYVTSIVINPLKGKWGMFFLGIVLHPAWWIGAVRLAFIRPGKPNENAHIESWNGKFRNECLNDHWFTSLKDARQVIAAWREEYNTERTHRSLSDITPAEFVAAYRQRVSEPVSLTADSKSGPY